MAEEKAPRRRRRWIVLALVTGLAGWYVRSRAARPAPPVPAPRVRPAAPIVDEAAATAPIRIHDGRPAGAASATAPPDTEAAPSATVHGEMTDAATGDEVAAVSAEAAPAGAQREVADQAEAVTDAGPVDDAPSVARAGETGADWSVIGATDARAVGGREEDDSTPASGLPAAVASAPVEESEAEVAVVATADEVSVAAEVPGSEATPADAEIAVVPAIVIVPEEPAAIDADEVEASGDPDVPDGGAGPVEPESIHATAKHLPEVAEVPDDGTDAVVADASTVEVPEAADGPETAVADAPNAGIPAAAVSPAEARRAEVVGDERVSWARPPAVKSTEAGEAAPRPAVSPRPRPRPRPRPAREENAPAEPEGGFGPTGTESEEPHDLFTPGALPAPANGSHRRP